MKVKSHKQKAIQLVSRLLLARRNQNIKAEQIAHENLNTFCTEHNYNMEEVINGATKSLQHSVAAIMNGLV